MVHKLKIVGTTKYIKRDSAKYTWHEQGKLINDQVKEQNDNSKKEHLLYSLIKSWHTAR